MTIYSINNLLSNRIPNYNTKLPKRRNKLKNSKILKLIQKTETFHNLNIPNVEFFKIYHH